MVLLALFGGVALVLSAIGIYGAGLRRCPARTGVRHPAGAGRRPSRHPLACPFAGTAYRLVLVCSSASRVRSCFRDPYGPCCLAWCRTTCPYS